MKSQTTRLLLVLALAIGLLAAARWRPNATIQAVAPMVSQAAMADNFPIPITSVCGPVTEFQAATANSNGVLTIGGVRLILAAGSSVAGFAVGANVCATFCFGPNGLVSNVIGGVTPNAGVKTTVCGIVSEWNPNQSLSIGGSRLRLQPWEVINGQNLIAPGLNICLSPIYNDAGRVTGNSTITFAPGTLPVLIPALVQGTKFGPNYTDGDGSVFRLPTPFVLNVQRPIPAGVSVSPTTAEHVWTPYNGLSHRDLMKFSSTTPNSVVRASTCGESLWDLFVQLETSGATEGDMVTLAVQNPDGSGVQVLAMFTIQQGKVVTSQIHPDVKVSSSFYGLQSLRNDQMTPLMSVGSMLRSGTFILAINPNSKLLSGCLQYFTEIKRAGGAGTTSVIHIAAVVKRMEQSGDRFSDASDLDTGSPGWFPTGLPCAVSCDGCLPPPPAQPLPGSLSGYVYCDNGDGIRQDGEVGIANVTVTLTGVDINGAVNQFTTTNAAGFYTFPNLMPGVYKITESQPAGVLDGLDTLGTLGGTVTNDMFSNIPLPSLAKGENYNFGENCATATPTPTPTPSPTPNPGKCDTVCWRATSYLQKNERTWPNGTVVAMGYNFNNPISVLGNSNAIRNILSGGMSAGQRMNKEFVTAQMSMLMAGGPGSPVVFNVFWSPLRCSQAEFAPVTLSNGMVLSPDSLLDTLQRETIDAIRDNRSQDFDVIASVWAQLNGNCSIF